MTNDLPILYHYVHCPFCLRVRFACNYLKIKYQSKVLAYDDEDTPLKLLNKKMLPIWHDKKIKSNESLEIIEHLDITKKLIPNDFNYQEIEPLLNELGSSIHPLAMPYWVYTYEFDQASRDYFVAKKEKKKGPFAHLFHDKDLYLKKIEQTLKNLANEFSPFYQSHKITLYDILLASHLWGLYMVPEFQFSSEIHRYLQSVKKSCHFSYHEDFWK